MLYKDEELPFLDNLFAGFDHENGIIDGIAVQVYGDFLDENDMPEGPVVRALGQLDANRTDHLLLKRIHNLNHRRLFEVIEPVNPSICGKGFPLNVIVNGWKTDTMVYFPPVKEDIRMVCFVTKTFSGKVPNSANSKTVKAGTWTESFRLENSQGVQKTPAAYGELIAPDNERYFPTVPGYVKKALICGYLNHVRKDSERRCGFGPPKVSKKQRKKVADAT